VRQLLATAVMVLVVGFLFAITATILAISTFLFPSNSFIFSSIIILYFHKFHLLCILLANYVGVSFDITNPLTNLPSI